MKYTNEINPTDTATVAPAIREYVPEENYGAVSAADGQIALAAFHAYDEGAFDEAPYALQAYLDHHMHNEVH